MISFLFWNTNKQAIPDIVAELCDSHQIDVLVLVECSMEPAVLLPALNIGDSLYRYAPGYGCEAVQMYTRFPSEYVAPVFETSRLTIRRLELPGLTPILIAATHFISKLRYDDVDQTLEATKLAKYIGDAEQQQGLDRTVLVGDLNMNPFEDGMVSAGGLHAVMCRKVAEKGGRTVQSTKYPFFYNPMWNLLGDETPGPPGTYHYSDSGHRVYFWNMYDQLLVRPSLMDRFSAANLQILTEAGRFSLVSSSGLPASDVASDHLPLVFGLSL